MSRHQIKITSKWPIAGALMLLLSMGAWSLWKFDIKIALSINLLEGILLLWFGERLIEKHKKKALLYPHFIFGMLTISVVVLTAYLFSQAARVTEKSYIDWLTQLKTIGLKSNDYEIGTLILSHYLIMLCIYSKEIWRLAKRDISNFLPSFWCILLGMGLMICSREGVNYTIRITSLFCGGGLMMGYLVYKTFVSREQSVVYHMKPKQYVMNFIGCILGIWMIGIYLPEYQELPGTRLFRTVANAIGAKPDLYQKIPYETRLNSDIAVSDAVLFEVSAMEPLYLREMAYSEYIDGIWSVPDEEVAYEYMDFKSDYLKAEYAQLDALLDEITFQNRQNPNVFPEYARMANYETSVVRTKIYTVLQNPINKINYFTVNDFFDIQDNAAKKIYYYQSLNNGYFHSENIVEPSHYRITYYDRVPKMGSREYVFLRSINGATWENIYSQVIENRAKYGIYNEKAPKILSTYTPLLQYQNAKEHYLQVPEGLEGQLRDFTKKLTVTQKSDWGSAAIICNFLKNNYTYYLQNKEVEGDRISKFLFEDKAGICQDFATSMTLMCRSIGIPAKYVTGYRATEKNKETGNYIIREKDAHAFVEVYIAGYGWMSFDPTPDSSTEELKEESTAGLSLKAYINIIAIGSGILIIILISRGGLSFFEEKWWLLTFRFTKSHKQLERLMVRQEIWLEKGGFPRDKYETLSQYAQRLRELNLDISMSVKLYEAQKYGALQPTRADIRSAYESYKALKIALNKLK